MIEHFVDGLGFREPGDPGRTCSLESVPFVKISQYSAN